MSRAIEQESAILDANDVKRFIEDPLFRQAVADAEGAIYWAWRHTDPEDTASREALYHEQRALDRVQKQLTKPLSGGTFARAEQKRDKFRANLE